MGISDNNNPWRPASHGKPRQLTNNLWMVDAALPHMDIKRRMTIVQLPDHKLLLYSVICLDDAGMTWLESLGEPSIIVVPNGYHRTDAPRYKARFPKAQIWAPTGSAKRIRDIVPIDRMLDTIAVNIPGGVSMRALQGTRNTEAFLTVHSDHDTTHVFCDAIFNVGKNDGHGLFWLIYMRWLGNAGKPRVTTLFRMSCIGNKRDFARGLREAAVVPGLKRIIMAHGEVIEHDARQVLEHLADTI